MFDLVPKTGFLTTQLIIESMIWRAFKGLPISKALTGMKIHLYMYKKNGNFVKETDTSDSFVV